MDQSFREGTSFPFTPFFSLGRIYTVRIEARPRPSLSAGGLSLPTTSAPEHWQSQRDCIIQPRVARHELPWENRSKSASTPTRSHRCWHRFDTTPLGLADLPKTSTQGSSFLATLGLVMESLWDSRISRPEMWVTINPGERAEVRGNRMHDLYLVTFNPRLSIRPQPAIPPTPLPARWFSLHVS